MTRDELSVRSEGALDIIDAATKRYDRLERVLRKRRWFSALRDEPTLLRNELDAETAVLAAVERLERLDHDVVERFAARRLDLTGWLIDALRQLDIDPTSRNVEELVAQLAARAGASTRDERRIRERWRASDRQSLRNSVAALFGLPLLIGAAQLDSPWAVAGCAACTVGLIGLWVADRPWKWRCPMCGRRFHETQATWESRNTTCVHCGHQRPRDA